MERGYRSLFSYVGAPRIRYASCMHNRSIRHSLSLDETAELVKNVQMKPTAYVCHCVPEEM